MCLAGAIVNRDLPLSRDLFRRAAAAGHAASAATFRSFVANGTGASPDSAQAVRLLEEAAVADPQAQREVDVYQVHAAF